MSTRVITVSTRRQAAQAGREAAGALRQGALVGFPTETVYGIAAAATDESAMARLREIKSRPRRPFSVHLARPGDAARYVRGMPTRAARLIERAWPGPVTLVVPTGGSLADAELQKAGLHDVLCMDGLIGLRCPAGAAAEAMLSAVEAPVVAPSANLAGSPSPRDAAAVLAALDGRIDLLIDSGPTRYGQDSTIVECRDERWKLLREGVYDERALRRVLYRKFLFVCTGNTCRSPMAAGLARKMLAERWSCRPSELPRHGVEAASAGISAGEGRHASPEAAATLRGLGVDISRHRSRKLTAELIEASDMILCLTDEHVEAVCRLAPSAAGRTVRLEAAGEISDPIGGGPEAYRRAAREIQSALEARLDKELP